MSNTDTTSQAPGVKRISIHDQEFEVTAPYVEGHVLTAIEAKQLNQVRAENIANNFRKKVKDALEGAEGAKSLDEVRADFATYDAEYVFTEASAGGGASSLTPVEREARSLARSFILEKLKADGRKRKDIDDDKFESEVVRISSIEKIIKLAEKNVRARQKAQDEVAALLSTDSPNEGEAAAA